MHELMLVSIVYVYIYINKIFSIKFKEVSARGKKISFLQEKKKKKSFITQKLSEDKDDDSRNF